jgi:peptidoglycan/LPS O-acetylase OafA/YrhL
MMALLAFLNNPHLYSTIPRKIAGFISQSLSPTITAFCIGGVLIYVTGDRDSIAVKILNNRVVRHVGVLSYSLYLWQQIFMSRELSLLPYGYLYTFGMAEFSFWLVEKPSLRLRSRLEARWFLQSGEGRGA